MKKLIVSTILLIISYLLQTTLMPAITLANVCPNILLIIIAYIGYINGRTYGMFFGLFGGLLFDLQFNSIIGLYALIYMIIGYLSGICHKIYFREDYTLPVILITVDSIIYGCSIYITEFLFRSRLDYKFYFINIILPETIYTVLVSIIIYKLAVLPLGWAKKKKEVQSNVG